MYERVKRLYAQGKLTVAGVKAAISKGWITETQYEEIIGTGDSDTESEG